MIQSQNHGARDLIRGGPVAGPPSMQHYFMIFAMALRAQSISAAVTS